MFRFSQAASVRLTVLTDTPKAMAIWGILSAVDRQARAIAPVRFG